MLGRDHALMSASAFAALAPALHAGPGHVAAGIALTAGAGVLPDLDHPDSTVSRSFGFLTESFAWLVSKASGGHRHGTHSLAGVAVFTAAAYLAGACQEPGRVLSWRSLPAVLVMSLLYSAAFAALRIGGHSGDLLGTGSAVATAAAGADLTALPLGPVHVPLLALVTALGCAAHIAGDCLTHSGCPVLWPASQHDYHLLPERMRFTTGKTAELWVMRPLLTAALGLLLARDAGALA